MKLYDNIFMTNIMDNNSNWYPFVTIDKEHLIFLYDFVKRINELRLVINCQNSFFLFTTHTLKLLTYLTSLL